MSKPHNAGKAWCLDEGLQVETVDNWLLLDDVAFRGKLVGLPDLELSEVITEVMQL
jgi:hypothetical protein